MTISLSALLSLVPAIPADAQVALSRGPGPEIEAPSQVEINAPIPTAASEDLQAQVPGAPVPWTRSASEQQEPPPEAPACPADAEPPGDGAIDCVAVRSLSPVQVGSGNPKISDAPNGADSTFELVAVVSNAPPEAVVEAFLSVSGSESPLGELERVAGSPDTFELAWDVPATLANGNVDITMVVRRGPEAGAQELFRDTVTATLSHHGTTGDGVLTFDVPPSETAEITWPPQAGPLGFYKPIDGDWATVISGLLSAGADSATNFTVHYSKTPIGREPTFTQCGSGTAAAREEDGMRPFVGACTLAGGDLPSQVTAVAVVPQRNERSSAAQPSATATPQSPDVHRVAPFIQRAGDMEITLKAIAPSSPSLTYPGAARRVAGDGCLEVAALVTDQFGSPVQGANVDVELAGPGDALAFGSGASSATVPSGFEEEDASNCSGGTADKQATMIISDAPDAKRLESATGTGTSPANVAPGEWRFRVFSPEGEWGTTTVYAWADEQPRDSETTTPSPDNEFREPDEPLATAELTWLGSEVTLSAARPSDPAPTDSCYQYALTVAGGNVPLGGVNVDVHIRGPKDEVRFCDPPGATELRQPDKGEHGTEEEPSPDRHPANTANVCPGEGPSCLHREGTTDTQGHLIFGLSSESAGDTTISAWFDGEEGSDDDLNNAPFATASLDLTTSWVASADDVKIEFVNPAGNFSQQVTRSPYRIVAAVNAPYLVEKGVEMELVNSDNATVTLGTAKPVARGDTYELIWDLDNSPLPGAPPAEGDGDDGDDGGDDAEGGGATPQNGTVPDGAYTLRAQVAGTAVRAEADISVDREANSFPANPPLEGAAISLPVDGGPVPIRDKEIKIAGTVTPGAEQARLFYSVAPLGTENITWIQCGTVDTPGGGTDPKAFEGVCTLQAAHSPEQVTRIGARAFDCTSGDCTLAASLHSATLGTGMEMGDAIRVLPCDTSPCVLVTPTRWQARKGTCQRLVAQVGSFDGPVAGEKVDVAVKGPGGAARFCKPFLRGTSFTGTTDDQGRLAFGVTSERASFRSIFSPVETGVTTITARLGDATSNASLHWDLPGRCTVIGTRGKDVLTGTVGDDIICGLGGNDVIFAQEGDDLIYGGPGNDIVHGDEGHDVIRGESGKDRLFGGAGRDLLLGGAGNDRLYGEQGRDVLDGGGGRNACRGGGRAKNVLRHCHRRAPPPQRAKEETETVEPEDSQEPEGEGENRRATTEAVPRASRWRAVGGYVASDRALFPYMLVDMVIRRFQASGSRG